MSPLKESPAVNAGLHVTGIACNALAFTVNPLLLVPHPETVVEVTLNVSPPLFLTSSVTVAVLTLHAFA